MGAAYAKRKARWEIEDWKTGKTGAAYAKRKARWALEDSLGQIRACILREKPVRA